MILIIRYMDRMEGSTGKESRGSSSHRHKPAASESETIHFGSTSYWFWVPSTRLSATPPTLLLCTARMQPAFTRSTMLSAVGDGM